ncbi:hypothetical protein [Halospeciosus flavus]|uniref:Transcriptional regulator n=1 Tax=Halospeciosus flavus TaxID=3032283 RepID=A0ABD5Z7G6_9EURY|nr:hypothetical protein [Halospeciosus flavus]
MPTYTVEADSLEDIADDLADLGVAGAEERRFGDLTRTFARLLDGVREAHERTDGEGNQQSKIAEYAGLADEFDSERIGAMLDVLSYFGHVEKVDRRYRLGEHEQ